MSRFRTKSRVKSIIIFALLVILTIGVIGIGVKLNKQISTKTISSSEFSVGALNSSGAQVESEGALVSNFITVDGLEISIKEDADITYKVYFYTSAKAYIASSATDALSADFDTADIPDTAEYCRIEITPLTDTNISVLEKLTYANQLTITVNK